MYSLRHYPDEGRITATLAEPLDEEQVQALVRDVEQRVLAGDRPVSAVLVDQRRAEPLTPELTAQLTSGQVELLGMSPLRIAQLVGDELVAHQLDRVAESQATDGRLRYFWQVEPARAWLAGGTA